MRLAVGAVLATLLATGALAAPIAGAATSTKYYEAGASPTSIYVATPTSVTVTLTNEPSSQQSFGSAELTIGDLAQSAVQLGQPSAPGWLAQFVPNTDPAVVKLTNPTGSPIPNGGSISIPLTLTSPTATPINVGTEVKQANDFSGSGNAFSLVGPDPTITVIPLTLKFLQQPPPALQQSVPKTGSFSYMCPPVIVQLELGGIPVSAPGVAVTISPDAAGLYYYIGNSAVAVPSAGVTVVTNGSGTAVFGTVQGTSCVGLAATTLGADFTLTASSPAATSPTTSNSFSVVQSLVSCSGSVTCTADSQGSSGTTGIVAANSSGSFQLLSSFGLNETLSCDSLVATVTADPLVVTSYNLNGSLDSSVSGTVTLTFPKAIVNSVPNNGTPLMPVCVGATQPFPTPLGSTNNPGPYPDQGLLYGCTDSAYLNSLKSGELGICVASYAKIHGGAEQIVIDTTSLGDPMYW
ncbi:MAG: hypothetical protein M0T72_04670 [Candidatus Dormibacteraeota bacterium]|nr:hypothetical protein [Candidatus Dormibacteraeota bacterium]